MDEPYKAFNHAIKTFIRDLIEAFPEIKDFKTFLTLYKMAKSISKKFPQSVFSDILVSRYRMHVINEDPSFLSLELFNNDNVPVPMRLLVKDLNQLQNCWFKMNEEDRKNVWNHLKVLVVLSDKCAMI